MPHRLRLHASHPASHPGRLRVASYNIHKGVRGLGPRKRLEIHNLKGGIEMLEADLVALQEVRLFHHREARRFSHGPDRWPQQGQAEFLAPAGYQAAYRTNAITRHGEHGNALLSRLPMGDVGHHDVSDHRFEQRGLLHVPVYWQGQCVHVVVAHFGLVHTSRVRQVQRLANLLRAEVPATDSVIVAGDFNDWAERLDPAMAQIGLQRAQSSGVEGSAQRAKPATFPALAPVFALDRFYVRGLQCVYTWVPRGAQWARMSDHLPVVMEFEFSTDHQSGG